ncbi:uncharacterized protein LOC111392395 [Olea europaea var. sylvestris]|uniref:uncharacterized protein LOC111392395 n=1 Tax=Olea europaea var. sylvestris TaxID=158386 RepID=UPI000C1CF2CA|nr:uncharacterized protein LOC111392395 [Olea europaea var. sylvestris]
MDKINVFICYGGKWTQDNEYTSDKMTGIVVPMDCTYNHLECMICSVMKVSASTQRVKIQYRVKKNMPLMEISDDISLTFYLELKRKDKDLASFPLCINVTTFCEAVTDNSVTSAQKLPSMEEIAIDVYNNMSEVGETTDEGGSDIISMVTMDGISKDKVFKNKTMVKRSISIYAIHNNFQFKVSKSNKKEYVLKCIDDKCKWTFRASRLGGTDMFKVRYRKNVHICSNNIILGDHPQATSSIVGEFIMYKYISTKTTYTPADIISDMMNTYGVSMSYEKAWRSKEKALELVRGDPTESYEKLLEYLYMIEQTNPGSFTKIETYQDNKFKYLFMALGAFIQGWKYCRPVIVIDATFLKGNYGRTLFTACTQDANKSIFILAFGVGDLETNDSWEWFLSMLKEAYGEREGLCIISDGHASIKNAIHKVYENAMHGLYSYHLLKNLKSSFGGKKRGRRK